jgi:8-amino-7-oxononanoate synthase
MRSTEASPLLRRLDAELASLEAHSQLRHLEILPELNFSSNDYLGLSADPRLRAAVAEALAQGSPVGSTGSRLLSGHAAIWEELELQLARFTGAEAALYFSSGYAANVGLFSAVLHPDDVVFSDSANHASIIDGIRLSGARKVIFPHLDLNALEHELRQSRAVAGQRFIAVESVFSMDGDRAPLRDLIALADRHGAELIVDEAHATGVFGPQGRGLMAAAQADGAIFAAVHTCGKALAGMGAFVSGSRTLKQFLINRARTFIFSTALPPYLAAQMCAAIGIVASADSERERLADLAAHLRARLRAAAFDTAQSDSQIVPVLLGTNERALQFAARLQHAGFAVRAIRPPTVPAGSARLRLSLTVRLSREMLDRLVDALIRIRDEDALSPGAGAHAGQRSAEHLSLEQGVAKQQ